MTESRIVVYAAIAGNVATAATKFAVAGITGITGSSATLSEDIHSTFTVLAEDGAALISLALAALGIYGSQRLQMPVLDGAASVAIGILLAGVAVALIYESRGLLIGEGVSPKTATAIRQMIGGD